MKSERRINLRPKLFGFLRERQFLMNWLVRRHRPRDPKREPENCYARGSERYRQFSHNVSVV